MRKSFVGAAVLCLLAGCGAAANTGVATRGAGDASREPERIPASDESGDKTAAVVATGEPAALRTSSWVGAAASSDALLAGQSEQSVAVWVDVPKAVKMARPPLALGFTIDTSGSMAGTKIVHARAAAQRVLAELADGDLVSLHTFSDDAVQRVPLSALTADGRRGISAVIEELGASGGTNLFEGVRRAEAAMAFAPPSHSVRRVLVISDGRATAGVTAPDALAQLAEQGLPRGVQVTAVGVGMDYDEATLNALALRSSGRLYHVAESSELSGIVEREMGLLESTAASSAELEIVAAPGVTLLGSSGAHTAQTGSTLRVPLGSLHAGQSRELLVRLRVDDATAKPQRALLSARLRFQDLSDGGIERIQETIARASLTDRVDEVVLRANPRAQAIIAMQQAALFANNATEQANLGNLALAQQRLAQAEAELRRGAEHTKDEHERGRMLASASRMSGAQQAMKAAATAPPAKQRAVGRASALDMNDAAMDLKGF